MEKVLKVINILDARNLFQFLKRTTLKKLRVGARAVITKDISSDGVAAGVLIKVIQIIQEYQDKVEKKCEFTKTLSALEKRYTYFKNTI